MNKLYLGDNLEIMREMEAGHVELICTDPPFNSGRTYNAFFKESKAQKFNLMRTGLIPKINCADFYRVLNKEGARNPVDIKVYDTF